jgi:hypothetical protein
MIPAVLQMLPGQVKWLTEQPMFFISGIWTSSLVKLYHFGAVKLGLVQGWKGSGGCDTALLYQCCVFVA